MKTVFVDENLEQKVIGGLYVSDPHHMQDAILMLQNQHRFFQKMEGHFEEIKYNKIAKSNMSFYKAIIDIIIGYDWSFFYMEFPNISLFSYKDFIAKLHTHIPGPYTVLLDYIGNIGKHNIEDLLSGVKYVNGALRLDSKSTTLLQVADLLLGLITRNPDTIASPAKKEAILYFRTCVTNKIVLLENHMIKKASSPITNGWFTSYNTYSILQNAQKARENRQFATVLITGATGMLGSTFRQMQGLEKAGYSVMYADRDTLDITDMHQCEVFFDQHHIDVIINCAAYTNVEQAEDTGRLLNYHVNTLGPINLALMAKKYTMRLIHISTDYVFDGTRIDGNSENDTGGPLNQYGLAKYMGEEALLRIYPAGVSIIRTSRLYGGGPQFKNFVNTMLTLGKTKPELRVINDQRGAPTYTVDLVYVILQLVQHPVLTQSIFHWCNHTPEGGITRYDFARQIFAQTDNPIPIHPIPSTEYPTKALRPRHSHLINNSSVTLPDRKESLSNYLI